MVYTNMKAIYNYIFRFRRGTLYWSHHKDLRRNIQRHLNDLEPAELSLQQQDIHLEHEGNYCFI